MRPKINRNLTHTHTHTHTRARACNIFWASKF